MKRKIAVYFGAKHISGTNVALALLRLKMPFAMVTADEIRSGGLERYPAVILPGGHFIRLDIAAIRQLVKFIEAGGGCLGICAGIHFAVRHQLIPVKLRIFRAGGIFNMPVVKRHPVTAGYRLIAKPKRGQPWRYSHLGRVRLRYANGGLLEAGPSVDVLVTFDEDDQFGAIVAGRRGKGRVVLMSPHPEATPIPDPQQEDIKHLPQDPFNLFANAVKWLCAKINTIDKQRESDGH